MSSYSILSRVRVLVRYISKAKTRHGIHSPFVYEFIEQVIQNRSGLGAANEVESLRRDLLNDQSLINYDDFGATGQSGHFTVSKICKKAAKSPLYTRLLYRISKKYKPTNILELGTSLGISASALATGNRNSHIISIEGSKEITEKAKANFEKLNLDSVQVIHGLFDEVLPTILINDIKFDLIYIDGNHSYEATKRYVEMLKPFLADQACIILDDIHWSAGMEKIWDELVNNSEITLSIDLFQIGLIWINRPQPKEHFVLRPF